MGTPCFPRRRCRRLALPVHPTYPLPGNSPQADWGAAHGSELPYVFGHLDQRQWAWTAQDRRLSTTMSAYWTNFARSGNPNGRHIGQCWTAPTSRATHGPFGCGLTIHSSRLRSAARWPGSSQSRSLLIPVAAFVCFWIRTTLDSCVPSLLRCSFANRSGVFEMKSTKLSLLRSSRRLRLDVSMTARCSRFAVLSLIAVFALGGCGDGGTETESDASTAAAPPADEQTPAVSYKKTMLEAEQLHDIELPEVGHFRLLVDGQLFTGPFGSPSTCRLATEYGSSPFYSKEFVFSASRPIDRTSYMHISVIRRLVSDKGDWTHLWPHESDEVEVSLNLSGTRPASRQWVRRVQPGGESFRFDAESRGYNAGPHELPVIRVRRDDHIVVTAVGELHPFNDHPDLPTGPFELAAVCPE